MLLGKYIKIAITALVLILGITVYTQHSMLKSVREDLSISKSNEKAFISENNGLKENNIAFKFTIDQLNYFNDSLTKKLNDVRKELKIKDDDIKQMQYLLSEATKSDTVKFTDTIFVNKNFYVDTLIGDEWYNIRLGLKYPNLISTTPTFKSESYIIVSSEKQTIDPPKKCIIARIFQRKHRIVEVKIVEKNPYIRNKQQRFIEIIK